MISIRPLTPDDWEENRAIRLEGPKMAIFGLFDGEALAGLTAIYIADEDPSGKTAGFAMSYIRPAWRGQGHAATLHRARLDWARANGMTRVVVSHRASNAPSRKAIERSSFTRTGAAPYRWPDGVEEDNVEYELRL